MLLEEAVDGGLKINDRVEDAALQPPLGELGEEALDGVEPGAEVGVKWKVKRCGGRAIGAPWGACGRRNCRGSHGRPSGGNLGLDGVEEADELLMPVALHVPADHRAVEDVERREQRRGAVPLVIVGHGAGSGPSSSADPAGCGRALDLALLRRPIQRWRGPAD